jgi:hypothetical protein
LGSRESIKGSQATVYPGDQITNIYVLDTKTAVWNIYFNIARNSAGVAAQMTPVSGSLAFDPQNFGESPPLDKYQGKRRSLLIEGNLNVQIGDM